MSGLWLGVAPRTDTRKDTCSKEIRVRALSMITISNFNSHQDWNDLHYLTTSRAREYSLWKWTRYSSRALKYMRKVAMASVNCVKYWTTSTGSLANSPPVLPGHTRLYGILLSVTRLKSSMPFKHDLTLQNIPLSKQPFKTQPRIGNEDVTGSPQCDLPATRTNKRKGMITTRSSGYGLEELHVLEEEEEEE